MTFTLRRKNCSSAPWCGSRCGMGGVRYSPKQGTSSSVLWAREGNGNIGKWSGTWIGLVFWHVFHPILKKPPFSMHVQVGLPYTTDRLSHAEIAACRAAVYFPGVYKGKSTFRELLGMGIPLLFPSPPQLEKVVRVTSSAGYEVTKVMHSDLRNIFTGIMEYSSFYRHPAVLYFRGIVHLGLLLGALNLVTLQQISARVQAATRRLVEDEEAFWRRALCAIAHRGAAVPSFLRIDSAYPPVTVGGGFLQNVMTRGDFLCGAYPPSKKVVGKEDFPLLRIYTGEPLTDSRRRDPKARPLSMCGFVEGAEGRGDPAVQALSRRSVAAHVDRYWDALIELSRDTVRRVGSDAPQEAAQHYNAGGR